MDHVHQPLDIASIRQRLRGDLGAQLLYFPATGSTNTELLSLPPDRVVHGLIAITDFQTAGRGRLRRFWIAPERSSVLFSVVLSWPDGVPAAQTMMLASLAVADTLASNLGLRPELKWPNDVLLAGKKVCGILGEMAPSSVPDRAVVGIGLNLNFDPAQVREIPASATSVQRILGRPIPREDMFVSLVEALEMWYGCLTGDRDAVFAAWSSRLSLMGERVSVRDATGIWDGTAIGVQPDGGLRVRDEGGHTRLIYAADVSLRREPGYFTTQ